MWLLRKNITCMGSAKYNDSILSPILGHFFSTEVWTCLEHPQVTITVHQNQGRDTDIIISSYNKVIQPSFTDKPKILSFYEDLKFDCRVVEKEDILCSDKPSLSKWTKVALSYLLDVALDNARVVSSINNGIGVLQPLNEATIELAKALITPFMQKRSSIPSPNLNSASPTELFHLEYGFMTSDILDTGQIPKKQRKISENYCKRCCDEKSCNLRRGEPGRIFKTRYACVRCNRPVCTKHRLMLCVQCL